MLRVGIVAEGKSEFLVFEEMLRALHPDVDVMRIWPDFQITGRPYGWRGVKAWCQEFGGKLETFMAGVQGKELHLLIIHADCSMAHNEGANRPCPPASDTADALRQVVIQQWLGLASQPPFIIVTHPSRSTDAWVVASLEPPYEELEGIECDDRVENELVARRLLRKKDGEVKKPENSYRPLAEGAAKRMAEVCKHCTQAARFVAELQAAAAGVAPKAQPGV